MTIDSTPHLRGFLLAWISFHESQIRLETGLITRPGCGLSDQAGLILWRAIDGVLAGAMAEQQDPRNNRKGACRLLGLILDTSLEVLRVSSEISGHRWRDAGRRQARSAKERLRTCVLDRYASTTNRPKLQLGTERKPSSKPSGRSMSRLERLLGPCWDGAILQLDSRRARRVSPRA
jgi:hypothetical protein